MQNIQTMDWGEVQTSLHEKGYALLRNVLSPEECLEVISLYPEDQLYRSVINMQRYRFGKGEYKYFRYPLSPILHSLRERFYEHLVPVANEWMKQLSLDTRFPRQHNHLIESCHAKGQLRPTPLILRYEAGGYNTLHQDLYGEIYFPFQVVFVLTQTGRDHEGGEFVLTEQVPRAQSKAVVLSPDQGDALIFTTNFRPVKGARGYYRTTMKHGVSEITSGVRYSLGIIFHDAA
ncbi:MAG TPA: 2OG-Fe(II) oxygenase [Ohtaekwangia sp.]